MTSFAERHRYSWLLGAILLSVLVVPALNMQGSVARWIAVLVFALLLTTAVHAAGGTRRARVFLIVTALVSALGAVVGATDQVRGGYMVRFAFAALFYGGATVLILRRVLAPGRVTGARVTGAICVYMLLGLIWASLYALIFVSDPASFGMTQVPSQFESGWAHALTYFSFTTLTTLGYGDITPKGNLLASLAFLQAATGVLYVAVLVARLVALQIVHETDSQDQSSSS